MLVLVGKENEARKSSNSVTEFVLFPYVYLSFHLWIDRERERGR